MACMSFISRASARCCLARNTSSACTALSLAVVSWEDAFVGLFCLSCASSSAHRTRSAVACWPARCAFSSAAVALSANRVLRLVSAAISRFSASANDWSLVHCSSAQALDISRKLLSAWAYWSMPGISTSSARATRSAASTRNCNACV
eukprot:CAMPEP_0114311688 /NCGR_PEP_ID=MMETSP0059-20121206/19969_1 /TAXON_ID=36894 /ORGANISM="Pyramimonas parkeae, Strain CCMP726" /LENGTH=147 /DNA_ID=CAMNT_0001435901 /DNA_START=392 /DNA_END=835 /DNA_ORIENTATION=+